MSFIHLEVLNEAPHTFKRKQNYTGDQELNFLLFV